MHFKIWVCILFKSLLAASDADLLAMEMPPSSACVDMEVDIGAELVDCPPAAEAAPGDATEATDMDGAAAAVAGV